MAPPKRIWTDAERSQVKRMAMIGIPQETIAKCLEPPTTVETLEKYFREELNESATKANALVAGALFKSAMGGNVAAQIFWCKTRLRWKETFEVETNVGPAILQIVQKETPKT